MRKQSKKLRVGIEVLKPLALATVAGGAKPTYLLETSCSGPSTPYHGCLSSFLDADPTDYCSLGC